MQNIREIAQEVTGKQAPKPEEFLDKLLERWNKPQPKGKRR